MGLDVGVLILGLEDLDHVGHNLLVGTDTNLGTLHDLYFKTEDTLTEFDVTDSNINEVVLGLTSGDLVTGVVLLGLGTLSTDLSGDNNLATGGTTTTHDGSHDVVGGHTDGGTVEQLVLKGLDVSGGGEFLEVGEGLDGKLDLVVFIVEVVSLFDEGLDLLNLTGGLVEEVLALGSLDTDLSGHVGGTDLNSGVTFETEGTGEELVKLGLEHSVSDELLLGVDLLDLLVCHYVLVVDSY